MIRSYDGSGEMSGFGSGVVVREEVVATNCHVVGSGQRLEVEKNQQQWPASLQAADQDRDVCSLRVPGLKAPPAALRATDQLEVGSDVYAIGTPKGLQLTLSKGIISGIRPVEGGRYVQTTASVSPGSSGGGLFDAQGRLIGLTTFVMMGGQNLNFALPSEWIRALPERHAAREPKGADPEPSLDYLSAESPAEQERLYLRHLQVHLGKHREYPRKAIWQRLEGVAIVHFKLDGDGGLVTAAIAKSSGHDLLDNAVVAMIHRATPLPEYPPSLKGVEMHLQVPISFTLD